MSNQNDTFSGACATNGERVGATEPYNDRREGASPEKYHLIALGKLSKQLDTPAGFIRLSGPLEHDNIVNGDGLRAVVWTQGCPNHCPGCQNPETWDYEAGMLVELDEIKDRLREFKGQAGLTFCGGEPFVQAAACKALADWVREELGWNV